MDDPDKCNLITPFELHGRWWRAGSDTAKAASGCLTFTPEHGLQLQLYDNLPGELYQFSMDEGPTRPIWGEVDGFAGQKVRASLFSEIETNQPNNPAINDKPPSHTIFYINRAILGAHAESPQGLSVASVHFSIADLESFANTRPVLPDLADQKRVAVDHAIDDPLEVVVTDPSMRVRVATLLATSWSRAEHNVTITYTSEISLHPNSPVSFDDGIEIVFRLINFLHLCARDAVQPRSIKGVMNSREIVHSFGLSRYQNRRRTSRDWLLTLKDFDGRFELVLNAWFSLVRKLGFAGHVYFSELASPSPVTDARFFHFAGCLEAFHREVVQAELGKHLLKKDYKNVVKELLAHLPTDVPAALSAAMKSSLSQANDHSFAERIDALFNSLESETQQLLTDEPQRFLSAVKKSRNKLAHITDGTSGETFEGNEYAHANLVLRGWLKILMLKECGVEEAIIRQRMITINYFYWGPFTFRSPA